MREKFHKGEIVSATRTFNGEFITGEFCGYRLFDDELPDSVVGTVHVSGDRTYDVDVDSLRHYQTEEEKMVSKIKFCLNECVKNDIIGTWDRDSAVKYLDELVGKKKS